MAEETTLTLEEYARRYLRPACEQSFGVQAMRVWDEAVALGIDLDLAARLALAARELRE